MKYKLLILLCLIFSKNYNYNSKFILNTKSFLTNTLIGATLGIVSIMYIENQLPFQKQYYKKLYNKILIFFKKYIKECIDQNLSINTFFKNKFDEYTLLLSKKNSKFNKNKKHNSIKDIIFIFNELLINLISNNNNYS